MNEIENSSMPLIEQWKEAVENKKLWEEEEKKLRLEILKNNFNFSENDLVEGVFHFNIDEIKKLTASFSIKMDFESEEAFNYVVKNLPLFPNGENILKELLRYKPSLNVGFFKKLPEEIKDFVKSALVLKSNSPQLKFVEKK
jgi:hypothetical protein